jgi:hypothetical protein
MTMIAMKGMNAYGIGVSLGDGRRGYSWTVPSRTRLWPPFGADSLVGLHGLNAPLDDGLIVISGERRADWSARCYT